MTSLIDFATVPPRSVVPTLFSRPASARSLGMGEGGGVPSIVNLLPKIECCNVFSEEILKLKPSKFFSLKFKRIKPNNRQSMNTMIDI